ncbi:hypothetical protein O181_032235 [Austropuccinia psidii MF-1]|uniref:Uncharacterized protein n=1 Tax=Austropuccinia psidii MF-1 TaxID=1389203 RepID=A0A9Q3H811_9BASI|nr:hypothetical protein [Austropuccinia psidii MF-1]
MAGPCLIHIPPGGTAAPAPGQRSAPSPARDSAMSHSRHGAVLSLDARQAIAVKCFSNGVIDVSSRLLLVQHLLISVGQLGSILDCTTRWVGGERSPNQPVNAAASSRLGLFILRLHQLNSSRAIDGFHPQLSINALRLLQLQFVLSGFGKAMLV